MTRINATIPPQNLTDTHLLAEHREICRPINAIKSGVDTKKLPTEFTLGKGHVRYFYNKLDYLQYRYELLYSECVKRGFNVTYYGDGKKNYSSKISPNATTLLQERITERLKNSKKDLRYCGKIITFEQAKQLLHGTNK